MSHIPSSAMPHAKTHEPEAATPATPATTRFPWLTLGVGGALVVGAAITAALALRPARKPARRRKTATRAPKRRRAVAKD